jgi:hypothetical protein
MGEDQQWVFVHNAGHLGEAEAIKGLLLSSDIPCSLEHDQGQAIGLPLTQTVQVAIYVHKKDVEEARELIEEFYANTLEDSE